jgi:NADH:ubiquinone oxidoreductase subunit E
MISCAVGAGCEKCFSFLKKDWIEVKKEMARYEAKESAIIPSLYVAQKENKGWISPEVISLI